MDTALALAERARPLTSDPRQLAPLEMVRSVEAMRRGSPLECHALTMAAGGRSARPIRTRRGR